MKKYISLLAILGLVLASCTKEDPQPTSAKFTTNIQGDLAVGEAFTIYLEDATGEFLSYFKGYEEEDSWGTGYGTNIEVGADSLRISGYAKDSTYTFTVVATSYGNWGETTAQDVQSVEITVVVEE